MTSPERSTSSRLFLMRHGETEWSISGQHTSHTDLPLTEAGEEQARALGRALSGHPFGLVLSSPRTRAARTAELAGFGDVVQVDENLVEWDYGAYEGRTSADIQAELGHAWSLWTDGVPAGDTPGESSSDVQRRVRAAIDRAQPELDAGRDVLMVAHSHLLRALTAVWLSLPASSGGLFSLSTGTVSELGYEHGRPAVKRWNCPPAQLPEL
ncbi:histidine phosphatase family protein [Planctomonas deserti]|uniref:histidine phosphatase family protein n=1 Tax=Planctomonas deserti TaxID=2144185 RepID=UPI000D3C751F|nr:histidine phosphatase family protein [Planctomonas deserti]